MKISCLFALFFNAIVSVSGYNSVSETELSSLRELYFSTNGDHWQWQDPLNYGPIWAFNSSNQQDPCADLSLGYLAAWQGIVCSSPPENCTLPSWNCSITVIDLTTYALFGTLPSSIGDLTALQYFYLTNNVLYGTIPSDFGRLRFLNEFFLDQNYLTDQIPSSLGALQNLQIFTVAKNFLSGTIPTEIGYLSNNLRALGLASNTIFETIPTELGYLKALQVLSIENNLLSGLPSSLGSLSSLIHFIANDNYLGSTIPSELGHLTLLSTLNLRSAYIYGHIPTSLGNLIELVSLEMSSNFLWGSAPSEIGQLSKLQLLTFGANLITGTIPQDYGSLSDLIYLSISRNSIVGNIPVTLGRLTKLQYLWLNSNRLSKGIPDELTDLTNLFVLSLGQNCLSSSLPTMIGQWSMLQYLYLNNNQLTGTVPTSVGLLKNAVDMWFGSNYLRDSLPTQLGLCSSLQTLVLSENCFADQVPTSFGLLSNLRVLYGYDNRFDGSIPSSFGLLLRAENVTFRNNFMVGGIPSQLARMSSLIGLELQYNCLAGTIPASLGNFRALKTLSLGHNRLSGTVPSTLASIRSLEMLSLTGNFFTGTLPSSYGNLTALRFFSIGETLMNGTIPSEYGQLRNAVVLELYTSNLSGTIPTTFSSLKSLQYLALYKLRLNGTVPAELGSLQQLKLLWLNDNSLSGEIPSSLAGIVGLQQLWVSSNSLTGIIPSGLGRCLNLTVLNFANNSFTGMVPSELGNLRELQYFYLSNNHFVGTIPSEFKGLIGLQGLELSGNRFSGSLAHSFFDNMTLLSQVKLFHNSLTGKFPTNIFQISALFSLQLQGNKFTGFSGKTSDPASAKLVTVDISDNAFSGTFPARLLTVSTLVNLAASGNCFSGEISDVLCTAMNLQLLSLDGLSGGNKCRNRAGFLTNLITGTLPTCLFGMSNLKYLYAADNALYGSLGELSGSTNLVEIRLSNNHLTGSIPGSYLNPALQVIELSYNRITDVLGRFESSSALTLSLRVNRLSGDIPKAVANVNSLDILAGNVFSCSSRDELPENDRDYRNANCGSDDLDRSLGFFLALSCLVAILVLLLVLSKLQWKYMQSPFLNRLIEAILFVPRMRTHLNHLCGLHGTLAIGRDNISAMAFVGGSMFIGGVILYLTLKQGFHLGTHTYQYRWIITGTMLSGRAAAISVLLFWLVILLLMFWRLIINRRSLDRSIMLFHTGTTSSEASKDTSICSYNFGIISSVLLINILVGSLVNGVYVFGVLKYSEYSVLLGFQICLALFKICWKSFISFIFRSSYLTSLSMSSKTFILTVIGMLNDVILPSFVFMCVDPNCFLTLFVPESDVTSSYLVDECLVYYFDLLSGKRTFCFFFGSVKYTSTYLPSFTYNFQCGTSLLEAFAPVIILSVVISSIRSLITAFLAQASESFIYFFWYAYSRVGRPLIKFFLPVALLPFHSLSIAGSSNQNADEEGRAMLCPHELIASQYSSITVLLTFGFCVPYVAAAVVIGSMIEWFQTLSLLSAYVSQRLVGNSSDVVKILSGLDMLCSDVLYPSFRWLGIVAVYFSALFVGLYLVDVSGDNNDGSWEYSFMFLAATLVVAFSLDACRVYFFANSSPRDQNQSNIGAEFNPLSVPLFRESEVELSRSSMASSANRNEDRFTTENDVNNAPPVRISADSSSQKESRDETLSMIGTVRSTKWA